MAKVEKAHTSSLPPKAQGYVPTHPGLFEVEFAPGSHNSRLVAKRTFGPDQVVAEIKGTTPGPKRWSSVQISPDSHIELNSDLLYMNHSCDPSAHVDVSSSPWVVKAGPKGIEQGQDITFFYPSTEWDMSQPFECNCGADSCLKIIRGAKDIPAAELKKRFINQHILKLKEL